MTSAYFQAIAHPFLLTTLTTGALPFPKPPLVTLQLRWHPAVFMLVEYVRGFEAFGVDLTTVSAGFFEDEFPNAGFQVMDVAEKAVQCGVLKLQHGKILHFNELLR